MLARALAIYGPVSVSESVCHKSVFCRNGWVDRAGFFGMELFSTYRTVCFNEIQVSTKLGYFLLELLPKLGT